MSCMRGIQLHELHVCDLRRREGKRKRRIEGWYKKGLMTRRLEKEGLWRKAEEEQTHRGFGAQG